MVDKSSSKPLPVIFIGHGSPMNAIENNEFTREWENTSKKIAERFSKPKCILCISAHWLNNKTSVLSTDNPKLIYDFYGFPKDLYDVKYPARGSAEYAKIVKDCITTVDVKLDDSWGIDHGTWSVLVKMYPKADIPVLQLSIDMNMPLKNHVAIGRELASLRSKGVLIIGSGNIVHNLGMMRIDSKPFSWAEEFDEYVMKSLKDGAVDNLLNYHKQKSAKYAVPTNDHYIPLLYVIGAADVKKEKPVFYCRKIFYSSLSMTCVSYGL